MLIVRYFGRRCVRLLQYAVIVGSLLFVASFFLLPSKVPTGNLGDVERMGMIIAKDEDHAGIIRRDEEKQPVAAEQQHKIISVEEKKKVNGVVDWSEYKNLDKKDWHDYTAMEADKLRKGPGEGGAPVVVPTDEKSKKLQDQLYRVNGYDAFVSDHIAMDRSVKDIRHPKCRDVKYISKLPTVTVIFPFHNEHNSTLLRSAHSILNRSPPELIKEIILVDDASTKDALKAPLDEYWARVSDKVKVVRTKKREGLIRARQVGAQHATADIIVMLDAHSEANYNWLPPLIEPIALDYRTVVCPFVDVVDCDTYEYRAQDDGARGSFDWEFNYKRLPITDDDRANPTRPFKSPVMAGGYFAISRKWFWELGGYDEGLDIWGGEQYELSFKVWQCHGSMVDAPCSRVGHIYRCKYVPFPNPGVGDFISRNYKRVAEVWMDEYKEHLYKRRTAIPNTDPGDLTKQKAVRERLKCKSFDWFMKEIAWDQDKYYPAVEPADSAHGELRNIVAQKCVDTQFRNQNERFELRKCIKDDPKGGGEQTMRLSFWKDIRPNGRGMCFDVSTSVPRAPVVLFSCHGMQGNQHFNYRVDTKQLYHPTSGQCLDCDPERGEIFMNPCSETVESQKWQWEKVDTKLVAERNAKKGL